MNTNVYIIMHLSNTANAKQYYCCVVNTSYAFRYVKFFVLVVIILIPCATFVCEHFHIFICQNQTGTDRPHL